METWIPDLHQVQGNVWPGFNKDHQAFVLIAFGNCSAGRAWLKDIHAAITSAAEVAAFKRLYKQVEHARPGQVTRFLRSTWINVALTWSGLRELDADGLDQFPQDFAQNQPPAPRRARDDSEVHALLHVAADRSQDLNKEVADQIRLLGHHGLVVLKQCRGANFTGARKGHEHFGFRDGISQPTITGLDVLQNSGASIPADRFILGSPSQQENAGLAWIENGSYLVFLELQQHVGAFRKAVAQAASAPPKALNATQLGAVLMGRWHSGAAAGTGIRTIADSEPAYVATADGSSEVFPQSSHVGRACPRWIEAADVNHHRLIRRGIPYGAPLREGSPDNGKRGLLFVAYQADIGQQFKHVWDHWLQDPDFPDRGAGKDPIVGLVDNGTERRQVQVSVGGGDSQSIRLNPGRFISPIYGGYFFVPGIEALARLAEGTTSRSTQKAGRQMAQTNELSHDALAQLSTAIGIGVAAALKELRATPPATHSGGNPAVNGYGIVPSVIAAPRAIAPESLNKEADGSSDLDSLIKRENPYQLERGSWNLSTPIQVHGLAANNDQSAPYTETMRSIIKDPAKYESMWGQLIWWHIGGTEYSLTKALVIPYTYTATDPDTGKPKTVQGNVLVGYNGPSWP